MDFFALNAHNLSTLHFVEVEDLHIDDLQLTVGECVNLERFVMQASQTFKIMLASHDPYHSRLRLQNCSMQPLDRHWRYSTHKQKPLSRSVDHLQLFGLNIPPQQLTEFISFFRELQVSYFL